MAWRWQPGRPPGSLGGRLYLPPTPTATLLTPPRAALHVRESPKPPDFLSTPPDPLVAQEFKSPQSPVSLCTPTQLFSTEFSLRSTKACAFMLLNTKRDNLTRRIIRKIQGYKL